MLQTVDVGKLSLAAYRGIAPNAILDEVERCAESLRGARVLHLNATAYGGGVSELLRSIVPLLNDLGLVAEWQVIGGEDEFFHATKAMHNALQGSERGLSEPERAAYLANAERNAALLGDQRYDYVFVHDPQPAPLLALRGKGDARWIWRCHIDTSEPNRETWGFLRDFLSDYDAAIFTMEEFLPPDLPVARVEVIPPAIDPLSPKNMPLPDDLARQVLGWIGVQLDQPLITQVSRFDPWKDPLGVIAAYRLAREQVPDLQLALAGSMALDDPEGWEIYRQISAEAEPDPQIHVFTNLTGVGNVEVNAFQRLSDVVVQKSLREGFGLVVSEALWKGTPVVAGRAGGIPLQMADGVGGALVDDVGECAEAIVRLLADRHEAEALAEAGRKRARQHFLLPRLILNELSLMLDLARERPISPVPVGASPHRDPVCGMAIEAAAGAPQAMQDGEIFLFCSESCRARFRADPERYLRARGPGVSSR
ncbi:MAG: glycosyltransferase [Thermoleophilia bacterium]|nr:glycosyltransferase [Thermoleophilia bacterium]